jgi:hypothetical protein
LRVIFLFTAAAAALLGAAPSGGLAGGSDSSVNANIDCETAAFEE